MKRIMAFLCAGVLALALTGCGSTDDTKKDADKTTGTTAKTTVVASSDAKDKGKPKAQAVHNAYENEKAGFQLEKPQKGETVAVIRTNMGDISLRLFPEAAPKAVENFTTHAKEGYYDGLTFHRIVKDFMIQGGDPKGNGSGGESIWGENFEDEFDAKLLNLRGALSMANSGVNTNGSQFFINQAGPETFNREIFNYDSTYKTYSEYYDFYSKQSPDFKNYYPTLKRFIEAQGGIVPLDYTVPEEVWTLYEKTGGNINLDGAFRESGGHTVFGQVYDGMDVVDAIAAVEVTDQNKPLTDVVIKSIKITTYNG